MTRQSVMRIREAARESAMKRWEAHAGVDASKDVPAEVLAADAHAAQEAGDGMARNWVAAYEREIEAGSSDRDAIEGASENVVSWPAARTALTEAADALNDETMRQAALAHEDGFRVELFWSSVLDRRTCERCAEMDGESVVLPEEFENPPPVHAHCRCMLVVA